MKTSIPLQLIIQSKDGIQGLYFLFSFARARSWTVRLNFLAETLSSGWRRFKMDFLEQ